MMQVEIELNNFEETTKMLDDFGKKLPRANRRDAWNIAQIMAKHLKREATKHDFTGELSNKTKARKLSIDRFGVMIPLYGIYQDRMRPHFVRVGGKRVLERWSRQKLGRVPKYLYVRPSHWITIGKEHARSDVQGYLTRQTITAKVVHSRGRVDV